MTVTVGNDKYPYDVAEGWGKLPKGYEWGQIGAVGVDSRDRVHVCTRTEHPVLILDRDGNFLRSWGEGILLDPHGICFDRDDNVYYVDREPGVILKFDRSGKKVWETGPRDQPSDTGFTDENRKALRAAGPFNYPTDIAVSATGEFYVSDGDRNAAVHKFSTDGKYLFSWGEPGDGPGQFCRPHSVWEADGRVFVADRDNNRIQLFTPEGKYIDSWGGFVQPAKIYVDPDGVMYVAELKGRVSILDLDGNLLARWGDPAKRTLDIGMFQAAHSCWADTRGDLYVGEVFKAKRLQKFIRKH
jgi:DNA-binding beta-propeller fold protein YncE